MGHHHSHTVPGTGRCEDPHRNSRYYLLLVIVPEGRGGKIQQGGNFEALRLQVSLGHDLTVEVGLITFEVRTALLAENELEEAVLQLQPLLQLLVQLLKQRHVWF